MWLKDEACPIESYLPWSATINCTIHLQLICQRPSRDYFGSSLRPKHTLTILYEVGCICLGNCLNPLTRGLHQLSYPQHGAYACFFSVVLQCESHIWRCSQLNSNLPCNMVFKGLLGPCLVIISSDILIVMWLYFHLVARKMVECLSWCQNKILILFFPSQLCCCAKGHWV